MTLALQGGLQFSNGRVCLGIGRRTARHRQRGQRARDGYVRLRNLQRVAAGRRIVVRMSGTHLHRLRAHVRDTRHRGAPVLTIICTIFYNNIVTADNTLGHRRRM